MANVTFGKITRDEIKDAEVNDMPPRFRLAPAPARGQSEIGGAKRDARPASQLRVARSRDARADNALGRHPSLSRLDALKAALQGERRGFEFYYAVAGSTTDPEIQKVAKEFVKEENEHVDTLKLWIAKEEASLRNAPPPAG